MIFVVYISDIKVFQSFFMRQFRRIVGILKKDDRFIISIGDRLASILYGKLDDTFRWQLLSDDLMIMLFKVLRDIIVLTKFTGEVAPYRSH